MATTLVLVFLIDSMSEFTIDFNKTMEYKIADLKSNEQECPINITHAVLKKVKEEFGMDIKPGRNYKAKPLFGIPGDLYDGSENIIDNSIADFNNSLSLEKMQIKDSHRHLDFLHHVGMEHRSIDLQHKSLKNSIDSECEKESASMEKVGKSDNASFPGFPEKAPFLVAIFETLSNVTAQTCAGTVLEPHWVLTAASCLNVLGHLRSSITNNTEQSQYTIIAEATNPFNDGSAHNVTEVILHPEHKKVILGSTMAKEPKCEGPILAMMRIEPGVALAGFDILNHKVEPDFKARAYGWIYLKNNSSADALKSVSIPVRVALDRVCNLNSTSQRKTLCLTTNDVDLRNISQLGSGGPVLAMHHGQARLVAVLHADERALLAAVPLAPHAGWIQSTLNRRPF